MAYMALHASAANKVHLAHKRCQDEPAWPFCAINNLHAMLVVKAIDHLECLFLR